VQFYCIHTCRGTTTAEKLRGTKVWVPTPAPRVRPKAGLGVGCGKGLPPLAVRVLGYHPRKIFENPDAKSCILVCEISCFLKTTAKKLLVPNLKVGGPVSPGPYGCCAYAHLFSIGLNGVWYVKLHFYKHCNTCVVCCASCRGGQRRRRALFRLLCSAWRWLAISTAKLVWSVTFLQSFLISLISLIYLMF